jgi:hypothetical protein
MPTAGPQRRSGHSPGTHRFLRHDARAPSVTCTPTVPELFTGTQRPCCRASGVTRPRRDQDDVSRETSSSPAPPAAGVEVHHIRAGPAVRPRQDPGRPGSWSGIRPSLSRRGRCRRVSRVSLAISGGEKSTRVLERSGGRAVGPQAARSLGYVVCRWGPHGDRPADGPSGDPLCRPQSGVAVLPGPVRRPGLGSQCRVVVLPDPVRPGSVPRRGAEPV